MSKIFGTVTASTLNATNTLNAAIVNATGALTLGSAGAAGVIGTFSTNSKDLGITGANVSISAATGNLSLTTPTAGCSVNITAGNNGDVNIGGQGTGGLVVTNKVTLPANIQLPNGSTLTSSGTFALNSNGVTAISAGVNNITLNGLIVDQNRNISNTGNLTVGGTAAVTGTSTFTGVSTFNGRVNVNGGLTQPTGVVLTAAAITLNAATQSRVKCDPTAAAMVLTLPAAAASDGVEFTVIRATGGANALTLKGNAAELIDATNTVLLPTSGDRVSVLCNGTQWFTI